MPDRFCRLILKTSVKNFHQTLGASVIRDFSRHIECLNKH